MQKIKGRIFKFTSQYGIVLVMFMFMIVFSIASPNFLTFNNFINVLRQISPVAIASVGMTMVIVTGGIDLSVGSVMAFVGVLCAHVMKEFNMPVPLVILLGLAVGAVFGFINGFAIAKTNIPSFIFTLAMMTGIRGVCYILTRGMPIFGFTKDFDFLGKGFLLGIPIPVLLMFLIFFIGWVIMNKTRFGRYVYAMGGNKEATRLSGVNVHRNLILTYVICSVLAAFAGLVSLSRLSSGQPSAGENFAFDIVTAVVLGGISITGGEGKFTGVIFGAIILGILSNGMTLLNVYDYYQMVIKCIVLILAVGFDQYTKRTRRNKQKDTRQNAGA